MSDKKRVTEYLADFTQQEPDELIAILGNVLRHYLHNLSMDTQHLETLSSTGHLDAETLRLTLHQCQDAHGKMYDMLTAAVLYAREHKKQSA